MMNFTETSLLTLILFAATGFIIIRLLFSIKDKKKRSTDLLFGIEEKKKKRNKSPNFIVEVLYNLSKAFYKLLPMFKSLATKRNPESIALLNAKLEKAGKPFEMDADELNKLKFFTALLFFFLLLIVAMGNSNTNFYFYAIAFGIVGFVYPEFFISSLLQIRAKKISLELPDAMDFIALCLAAGMNFQLAVEEYVKRNTTILADEFDVFINDIQVGFNRVDSFEHLLARNESPEFRSFLSSVIQGEQLGTPLRPVIMNQAEELRSKRRSNVEKEIATAPTKMLFPIIMFILPALLIIILGSVLIPSQEKKDTDMSIALQGFVYYRVTPGVKIYANGNEVPVYEIRKIQHPSIDEVEIQFSPGAIENEDQMKYIRDYMIDNKLQQAWFTRFDVPEGEFVKYYISVVAHNGQRASDYIAMRYVYFSIDGFNDKGVFETPEKKVSIQGRVTPGISLKAMMGEKELLGTWNEKTGEFSYPDISLKKKKNHIQFVLTDKLGLTRTVDKVIQYTGIYANVSFSSDTTVEQYGLLSGTATPNSLLQLYMRKNQKWVLETSIYIDDTGIVKEKVAIEPGVNYFYVFAQDKDGNESPKVFLEITRSLIE
ncbi:MAG TPA: type II secretion system F family protein [Caldisericia bacterium]|nr:type II secretion system F family protein [Caldisericia bacterium]